MAINSGLYRDSKVDKVNILGTEYKVVYATAAEDPEMETRCGSTDPTTKVIKLRKYEPAEDRVNNVDNLEFATRTLKRHEIIRGFLYESGLDEYYRDELIVNWIAAQFYKIHEAFAEVGASEPGTTMPYFKECGKFGCRRVDQDEYDKRVCDFERYVSDMEHVLDPLPFLDDIDLMRERMHQTAVLKAAEYEHRIARLQAITGIDKDSVLDRIESMLLAGELSLAPTKDWTIKTDAKTAAKLEEMMKAGLKIDLGPLAQPPARKSYADMTPEERKADIEAFKNCDQRIGEVSINEICNLAVVIEGGIPGEKDTVRCPCCNTHLGTLR